MEMLGRRKRDIRGVNDGDAVAGWRHQLRVNLHRLEDGRTRRGLLNRQNGAVAGWWCKTSTVLQPRLRVKCITQSNF